MSVIHLIDGEKGGVGKSFVARTMIQYGLDRSLSFVAVETDRSNPDVAGVYQDVCRFAVFSENEKKADKADSKHLRAGNGATSNCILTFSSKSLGQGLDRA